MSIYSIRMSVRAIMRQQEERQSQRGFSTGDPDSRDKRRCSVDSKRGGNALFLLSCQLSLSLCLFSFFSSESLGLSSHSLCLCLPLTEWLSTQSTANPLRRRLTQELMRLGHCRFLFPSLCPVLLFIYHWLLICVCLCVLQCVIV